MKKIDEAAEIQAVVTLIGLFAVGIFIEISAKILEN